jgi:cell cycle sensor histidine kinase DivJ
VNVAAKLAGIDLLLTVSDTGIGIAEPDLPKLGQPFFQARSSYDRPYEGTGLGLSVVKGLVELHGGQVDFKSRVGEGTRVLVRLPRAREAASSIARPLSQRAIPCAHDFDGEKVKRRA